jgi:hypothetical protein
MPSLRVSVDLIARYDVPAPRSCRSSAATA